MGYYADIEIRVVQMQAASDTTAFFALENDTANSGSYYVQVICATMD
jgi:hypothetical protein